MPPALEIQTPNQPAASAPRVQERGHLTLVDWEGTASDAPVPAHRMPRLPAHASPLRRTWVDRVFAHGFLILLVITALGVAASLVQH